ncbi:Ig-like domain-containing protein, partial [Bremerella alba]|uniref:Ig-like domain-containing protein n=1 Tax=Bremerella alba TaxID=980252 RepID=UPI001A955422
MVSLNEWFAKTWFAHYKRRQRERQRIKNHQARLEQFEPRQAPGGLVHVWMDDVLANCGFRGWEDGPAAFDADQSQPTTKRLGSKGWSGPGSDANESSETWQRHQNERSLQSETEQTEVQANRASTNRLDRAPLTESEIVGNLWDDNSWSVPVVSSDDFRLNQRFSGNSGGGSDSFNGIFGRSALSHAPSAISPLQGGPSGSSSLSESSALPVSPTAGANSASDGNQFFRISPGSQNPITPQQPSAAPIEFDAVGTVISADRIVVHGTLPEAVEHETHVEIYSSDDEQLNAQDRYLGTAQLRSGENGTQFQALLNIDASSAGNLLVRLPHFPNAFGKVDISEQPLEDLDDDGIASLIESLAANNGDGNQDGVADQDQGHVASFFSGTAGSVVTIDATAGQLKNVSTTLASEKPAERVSLPYGVFDFTVEDVEVGGVTVVEVTLPEDARPSSYYKTDPATGQWERFGFDGTTGAIIDGNKIYLYLQDGGRGDADGIANGVIVDPGGPGIDDGVISLPGLADSVLTGWTVAESGGVQSPGTVQEVDGDIVLTEGDSFLVTLQKSVVIPENPEVLTFDFIATFDSADDDFINDAFEVALVDQNGMPVVPVFQSNRDAFFNWTEDETAAAGSSTSYVGQTVELDISDLAVGRTYDVVFRLVNNDDDTTTTVTLVGAEPPAVAQDDAFTVSEDSIDNVFDVLANDTGIGLSISDISLGSAGGSLSIVGDKLNYSPASDFFGTETFTYTLIDENGNTDSGEITVTVTEVNDSPTAADDSFNVDEDGSRTLTGVELTGNDSKGPANESSQTLSVTAVGTASHGTVTLNPDGSVTYTPDADYVGPDSFTYTATDDGTTNGVADAKSSTATVYFTVGPVNDPPTATNDGYTVAEDSSANLLEVLANDSIDPDTGETLSIQSVGAGSQGGTITIVGDKISYTPLADFYGTETFSYTINDGTPGSTDSATVTITVSEVNAPPTAADDSFTIDEDQQRTFTIAEITSNDTTGPANESSQTLTITSVGSASHGSVQLNGDGTITYVPEADYSGSDSFTYTVTDNGTTNGAADLLSATATVHLTITAVNDPPVAVADTYGTTEGVTLNVSSTDGVLSNDTDTESQSLTAELVQTTGDGTLTLSSNGSFTYVPDSGFTGIDTFTYKAKDASGAYSETTQVTIQVGPGSFVVPGDPEKLYVFEVEIEAVNLSASYHNELGLYIVNNAQGEVGGLLPDESNGYAYAALTDATRQVVFAQPEDNEDLEGQTYQVIVPGGSQIAFYLAQNTTTQNIINNNTNNVSSKAHAFFSFKDANPDQDDNNSSIEFEHFRVSTLANGKLLYDVEDLDGGGDRDYNDLSFSVGTTPIEVSGGVKFLVADSNADRTYLYTSDGTWVGQPQLDASNANVRGITSTSTGDYRWTVDDSGDVFVYDSEGAKLGQWTIDATVSPEGIATDGTNLWIVDTANDEVLYFAGAASIGSATELLSGTQSATSSFSLDAANSAAKGITTDGTTIWVVDDGADKVFVYSASSGSLQGSWSLDSSNANAGGITIGAQSGSTSLWVVDYNDNIVYHYGSSTTVTSGSLSATDTFELGMGNFDAQGIADPIIEAGDTIGTAYSVSLTNGVQTQIEAEIGDGAYGGYDVDMFQISLGAGETLSADVDSYQLDDGSFWAYGGHAHLRLFDSSGNQVANADYAGGSDPDSGYGGDPVLNYTSNSGGTYYLGVSSDGNESYSAYSTGSGSTGNTFQYELELNRDYGGGSSNDIGDTISSAQSVNLTIGVETQIDSEIGDSAYGGLDVDMFQITLGAGETLSADIDSYQLDDGSFWAYGGHAHLRLFDSSGNQVANADYAGGSDPDSGYGGDPVLNYTSTSGGTYYLGVSSDGNESYSAYSTGSGSTGNTFQYELELNRDYGGGSSNDIGDTISSAQEVNLTIGVETQIDSEIGDSAYGGLDVDMFQITLGAGETLLADIDSYQLDDGSFWAYGGHAHLRLFDSSGNQVANADYAGSSDPDSGYGGDPVLNYTSTSGGTYYLGVSTDGNESYYPHSTGSGYGGSTFQYELELNRDYGGSSFNDIGDTISSAQTVNLTNGVETQIDSEIGDSAYGGLDVDMFQITLGAGETLSADIDSYQLDDGSFWAYGGHAHLRLFDSSGNQVANADYAGGSDPDSGYGGDPVLNYTSNSGGTYYLGVSSDGNESYSAYSTGSGSTGNTFQYELELNRDYGGGSSNDIGDTISSAQSVNLTIGVETQIDSEIGDSAYGGLDVDMFQITLGAGETLSADIDSYQLDDGSFWAYGGHAHLRLFDSSGNQVANA